MVPHELSCWTPIAPACLPCSVAFGRRDRNRVDIAGDVRLGRGMTIRWQCICVDTTDPARVAGFWQEALGWRRTHDSPDEVVLEPPAGSPEDGVAPDILFLRVPEQKTVKNRLHLDINVDDPGEVGALVRLGAAVVAEHPGWVVLADPEGNEFCILRNDAERAAS